MNIAAYCRVSTDKSDQLNSLETQKKFFAEYVQRTGGTLVRLYADEGISGTKTKNRREFLRLMRDAETGLFQMVAVKDISRFARNTVDLLQNIRRLKALGIETLFLTAHMTSMGDSEFILTIFGALAQEESANTSKRIKFGKRVNAERGKVPNLVFGYDKIPGELFRLAVNPREAEVVRQMFAWYVSEGCGGAKIASRLNGMGVLTKRGCAWSPNAVCRVLSNALYAGQIVNGKQEVADFLTGQRTRRERESWLVTVRPELALIDRPLFEAAQSAMRIRGDAFRTDRERHSNQHLFSTLIRCRECGWSFRRTVRTYRNTYVRWTCSGRSGKGAASCPNAVTLDEDLLAGALSGYFAGLLRAEKDALPRAADMLRAMVRAESGGAGADKPLRAELARLRKSRQKYMDMYADDLITREELNQRAGAIRQASALLEDKLKRLPAGAGGERLADAIRVVLPSVEALTDVRRMNNTLLRRIVSKIEVGRDGAADVWLRETDAPDPGEAS